MDARSDLFSAFTKESNRSIAMVLMTLVRFATTRRAHAEVVSVDYLAEVLSDEFL